MFSQHVAMSNKLVTTGNLAQIQVRAEEYLANTFSQVASKLKAITDLIELQLKPEMIIPMHGECFP